MIGYILAAHIFGDFALQNHWMQSKVKSSFVCSVHVACYSIPFVFLVVANLIPAWLWLAIITQHWLQDRFALHLLWMKFFRQTPPETWPVGPLCMDQSWHIGFIGFLCALCVLGG